MKIDLGCGYRIQPGYIGLDNKQLPGVEIVCDLNEVLPLENELGRLYNCLSFFGTYR